MSFPTKVSSNEISDYVGNATWLKASGTNETDLLEVTDSIREIVIDIKEMGSLEPGTQVLTFRIYRYMDGGWVFDDSVDLVPAEMDVMTVSDVYGRIKITLEPEAETQQNYTLPYTIYYQ